MSAVEVYDSSDHPLSLTLPHRAPHFPSFRPSVTKRICWGDPDSSSSGTSRLFYADSTCSMGDSSDCAEAHNSNNYINTSPLRRSTSFLVNLTELKRLYPEMNEGVIISMLESSQNDKMEAAGLLRHIREAHQTSTAQTSLKRRLLPEELHEEGGEGFQPDRYRRRKLADVQCAGQENSFFEDLDNCLSMPPEDHQRVDEDDHLSRWVEKMVNAMKNADSLDEARTRLRHLVQEAHILPVIPGQKRSFLCPAATSSSSSHAKIRVCQGSRIERVHLDEEENQGCLDTNVWERLKQSQKVQLILTRAVKMQYEQIRKLSSEVTEKTDQLASKTEEISFLQEQLARQKEANQMLQYYIAVNSQHSHAAPNDFTNLCGGPPDVF